MLVVGDHTQVQLQAPEGGFTRMSEAWPGLWSFPVPPPSNRRGTLPSARVTPGSCDPPPVRTGGNPPEPGVSLDPDPGGNPAPGVPNVGVVGPKSGTDNLALVAVDPRRGARRRQDETPTCPARTRAGHTSVAKFP